MTFHRDEMAPFVPVNCAALPEALAESLLFGHAKGAFTGATRSTEGFFSQAQGGTLFLDEIGELTLPLQAKLLRAIQEKEALPVGSSETQRVDVRIIAATNRDLRAGIRAGYFREDLYFRVSTFRINVPGLSSRLDDILPLANYLVKHGREDRALQLSPEASAKLLAYRWPGNVRELENVVQRAIVLSGDGVISANHLVFDEPADHELYIDEPSGLPASLMNPTNTQSYSSASSAMRGATNNVHSMVITVCVIDGEIREVLRPTHSARIWMLRVPLKASRGRRRTAPRGFKELWTPTSSASSLIRLKTRALAKKQLTCSALASVLCATRLHA